MSDAMQIAEQRRKEYRMAISKKENEIVELKERIEDLDNFIEFGQALTAKGEEKPQAVTRPAQPQQHPAPEAKAPEAQSDDEWGKAEEPKSVNNDIARVLSQRAG